MLNSSRNTFAKSSSVTRRPSNAPRRAWLIPSFAAAAAALVGYADLRRAPLDSGHRQDTLALATNQVPARAHARLTGVDARRSAAGTTSSGASVDRWIEGTVRTREGRAIPDADVCIIEAAGHFGAALHCTRANASGEYRLLAGVVEETLIASAPQHSSEMHTVHPSRDFPPFDFILQGEQQPNVMGVVLDASGGPVSGAAVLVRRNGGPEIVASTWSDENGGFRTFVAPGSITLSAQAESYAPARVQIDAPAESLTLVLAAGSRLEGEVVDDATEQPVADVLVAATAQSGLHGATFEVSTDVAGHFQFTGLHAAKYELTAMAERWVGEPSTVTLGVAETSNGVQLRVRPATTVSAVIRGGGQACARGQLQLQGPADLGGSSKGDGKVIVAGVVAGVYAARVSCPGSVSWSGELAVGLDPVMREWDLAPGAALRGRVERANGKPLPAAHVMVVPRDRSESGRPVAGVECVSDEAGEFECGGIAPGEYQIQLGSSPTFEPPVISIGSGARAPELVVLRAQSTATILAHIGDGRATRVGTFEVLARAANELPVSAGIGPDGHAHFDLPLGKYAVYLGPTSGVPLEARQVTLSADGERVEVVLPAPELLEISGVVLDAAGVPVPDEWVFAESTAIEATGYPLGTPALSNERGEFTVQDLIPGAYRILTDRSRLHRTLETIHAGARDVVLRLPD